MPQHIFEVELPDKSILEIDAPEDTPIEQIKARAQRHIETEATKAAQSAKFPTAAEGGRPDLSWYRGYFGQGNDSSRTAGQVASDQAANVLAGIPQAITGIPGAIRQFWGAATDTSGTKGRELLNGAVAPITTPAKQAIELASPGLINAPTPDDLETAASAQGAGAMLGSAVLTGVAPHVIKPVATTINTIKPKIAAFFDRPPLDAPSINKWMDVPARAVSYGANPGQQLLDERLIGPTKEITRANVRSALGSAGAEMEAKLKAADARGITIDAQTPTYDAHANAVKRIGSPRDQAFTSQMDSIVDDIEAKYPGLNRLTPSAAHALKVELGDSIKWSGTAYDTPANQAMIQIYRDINAAIKAGVPDIAPVQTRWGNLYIASKNLAESMADDVVGKGTGSAAPKPPLSPAARLGKKALPWAAGAAIGSGAVKAYRLLE